MGTVDVPGEESISFAELLWTLPLFDDLFLSMQGQNVMIGKVNSVRTLGDYGRSEERNTLSIFSMIFSAH